MRTTTGALTVFTALAVLAFVVPSALGSAVSRPAATAPGALAVSTGGVTPAAVIKVNSTGTAGYEAGQTFNSSASVLKASWIQPTVHCTSLNASALFGAFLVNGTYAQVAGTAVACTGGVASMYAWYAFSKGNNSNITKIPSTKVPVTAGAIVTATITIGAASAKITIKVGTHSVTKTHAVVTRDFVAAVGVAGYPKGHGAIQPLANFGTAAFGSAFTHVAGTSDVTFNGTKKGIGAFPLAAEVTLVDATHTVLAAPTALSGSASSFKITWKAST